MSDVFVIPQDSDVVVVGDQPDGTFLIGTQPDIALVQDGNEVVVISSGEQGPQGAPGTPGAGSADQQQTAVNGDIVILSKCMAVCLLPGNLIKRANADSALTKDLYGLVLDPTIAIGGVGIVQIDGVFTALTTEWDALLGTSGGLVQDADYFLDTVAGRITPTPPTTDGHYVCKIGYAISTTKLQIRIDPTVRL